MAIIRLVREIADQLGLQGDGLVGECLGLWEFPEPQVESRCSEAGTGGFAPDKRILNFPLESPVIIGPRLLQQATSQGENSRRIARGLVRRVRQHAINDFERFAEVRLGPVMFLVRLLLGLGRIIEGRGKLRIDSP